MTNIWVSRALHRLLPFLLALGVLVILRWSGVGIAGAGSQSTTIGIGFILIGAFVGGKVAVRLGLPRITGYLLAGMLAGPYVSGLLTKDMLLAAKAVEGIAVALIALTAGGELRIEWVRRQARALTLITLTQVVFVAVGVVGLLLALRSFIPFMPADDLVEALVIAFVFGALAIASSPTVTIAVIAETKSEGPVTRTVLGVTVLKDVCVIVLFAVALTVARDVLGEGSQQSLGLTLARELGGSVLVGLAFGIGMALFLRYVRRDTAVFVLPVCFAIWQVATTFHLETLLIALTAGFWVENFSKQRGDELIKGIERVSLPIYALFFAVAGAKVEILVLGELWPFALLLAGIRALSVWLGAEVGTRLAGSPPHVRKYAWMGFVSQAGVTLALSFIVARSFPTWGGEIQAIILAMIAIHELIGPILFTHALRQSGEVGAADKAPAAEEPRAAVAR